LAGDDPLELQGQGPAVGIGVVLVHNHGKRVHRIAVDHDIQAREVRHPVVDDLIIQGGVAPRRRFEPVEEIVDDFGEGQLVGDDDPGRGQIAHVLLDAAFFLAQLEHAAHVLVGSMDFKPGVGFGQGRDILVLGELARIVDGKHRAVGFLHFIDDRRGGGDEVGPEFPLQAFLDDLHVEQAEKAAPEAEAQGLGGLGLVGEGGVV